MSETYARLARTQTRTFRDHTATWERLRPIGQASQSARVGIERFCEGKRITFGALEELGARVKTQHDYGPYLAYAGWNEQGQVVAIKYRPLNGSSHDGFSEAPSTWLRPIVIGNRDALDWLLAEGETDAARLYGLVGDRCAILVLPTGARGFDTKWAKLIPRGATVALCHDADEDGDAGAEQAARIIGGRTVRIRPPVEGGDWCDWDGDREAFVALVRSTPKQASRLRVLDTLHLVTSEPPPLDWLAEGIFCRGKLTLLGGREKRGKSLVALALAVRIASGGGDVAGIAVKPGRVLLIDAENGEREIHRRLRAMGLEAMHAANLTVAEARGFELRQHLDLVAELAEDHRADLVLLDSFRALWRGDERDEAEASSALDPVRDLAHDTERSYSMIHHAQKGGEEYRGSSAIGASVEWCVMLDRDREDPDKTRRRLANPLARFAPERPDRWLSIRSHGDDGPVSLQAAEAFVREHQTPARDEIEAELREYLERCANCAKPLKGDGTVAHPGWTKAELASAIGRDHRSGTFRRGLERIADQGLIHRNGNDRWLLVETEEADHE